MTLDFSRQKSKRLLKRNKINQNKQMLESFLNKSKVINNINELLPGLNDISDAFEALPLDIIKYYTLLKEIDAKCIGTVPVITHRINEYLDNLHNDEQQQSDNNETDEQDNKVKQLLNIRDKLNDIIPCLEEKMHVTGIANDVIEKHLFRINNDYKLIINNNEIPESIRIGPLNHPAMIMDSSSPLDHNNPNRSAQSARSESRREALAAKKQSKEDDTSGTNSRKEQTPTVEKRKRSKKERDHINQPHQNTNGFSGQESVYNNPTNNPSVNNNVQPPSSINSHNNNDAGSKLPTPQPKAKKVKVSKEDNDQEQTYCYCNQVSFGEMVGCDGDDCRREWFHLPCIGFKHPPKGKWYCDDCLFKQKKLKK